MVRATQEDLPKILELMRRFNNTLYDVPLNEDKLVRSITSMLSMPTGVCLLQGNSVILGTVVDDPIRDWKVLVELAWWSEDSYGIKLLREFENQGVLHGVDEIRMTTLEVNPRVKALLERRGYSAVETSFRKLI